MKKIGISLLSAAAILGFTPAQAQMDHSYVSLKAGYSSTGIMDSSWDSSKGGIYESVGVVSFAFGGRFNKTFRSEVEFTLRTPWENEFIDGVGDTLKTSLSSYNFMANGYYDFGTGPIKPFVGAGIGFSINQLENEWIGFGSSKENHTKFAWQVMAGINFAVNDNMNLELSYRYFQMDDYKLGVDTSGRIDADIVSNEFLVGLSYKF